MHNQKRPRSMTYNDYGISKRRYEELKAFCLQYNEKKSLMKYGISGVNYDGMPHGNSVSNPTELQGMLNAQYAKDCDMIEQAAHQSCKGITNDLWRYVLRSVIYDMKYEDVMYDENSRCIPVGKTDFYGYRRNFYNCLNKIKLGTN